MNSAVWFGFGFLVALVLAAPGGYFLWRAMNRAERRSRIHAEDSELCSELIGAGPDGLFVWTTDGRATCSRRMAVLLNLPKGTESTFEDVRARFAGEALTALDQAIRELKHEGEPFDLLLPLSGGPRFVHVVGARTASRDGRWLADAVWMRDVTETSGNVDQRVNAPPPELSDDQEWMAALLDTLPMPVWLRDANLKLAFVNRACADDNALETTHDLAVAARRRGGPVAERRGIALEGAPRLYEITEAPLGPWPGTLGFAIDRSAAEEMEGSAARDTAARHQVFESLTTAIAIFGSDTRMVYSNSVYAQLWGLDPEWLAASPTLGTVLERLREMRRLPEFADFRLFKEEQLALFGSLDAPVEELLHLPSGATYRCLINPYSLGGLVFIYEDATERLALERSLNTLIAVQRETLDNLYEGVAVFGSDGRLKLSNPVLAKLWKLPSLDLEGEPHIAAFIDMTRPLLVGIDDWGAYKERVIARLMSRGPSTGRILRVDGSIVDYANVPLPDGAVLLSYLDVTDRTRLEEALRQRAEALHEANRLKSEFIANVAHEVRTPMNTVIGFADILAEGYFGELNPRQTEYIKGILETSQNLMSVVGDILDLATIEAGLMTLGLDTVDVHGMLASSLQLVRDRARRKNQNLEFDCPPDLGWIVADERRLRQVLFNLLSNAVNFTRPQGTIRLSARRDENEIEIAVEDNGIGIPISDQERIFQSFERGPELEGESPGAGLGLSLVKRFIELHGGSVEISSRPNKGTKVVCRLPAGGEPG